MSNRAGSIAEMSSGGACTQPTRRPVAMTLENVPAVMTPCPPAIALSDGGRSLPK